MVQRIVLTVAALTLQALADSGRWTPAVVVAVVVVWLVLDPDPFAERERA